jgi:hypothetical protein
LVVWAAAIGFRSLDDNSLLTHLATGRLIVDDGSVPTADPYSWSAAGEPWVVQSWLASTLYGTAERLAGTTAVRLVIGLQIVGLALLVWRLSRPAVSLLPRLGVAALALAVGSVGWSERPLLIGLLCFGAALLAAERGLNPRWLVPIGWVWVNSHGSFPLGLLVLGALAVGSRLDGERRPHELSVLFWLAVGMLLGAVNPLGPVLLAFPVKLLANSDALRSVTEWRAPGFRDLWDRVFLVQMALGWLALVRRPSWRSGLAVVVASALALIALRNIMIASLVLVPVLARGFGDLGTLRTDVRPRLGLAAAGAVAALAVLVGVTLLGRADVRYDPYPVRALAWMRGHGDFELDDARLVSEDIVGNFLTAVDGPRARVFYDDRFDMYPDDVTDDYLELFDGSSEATSVLERRDADLVLWRRTRPLPQVLAGSPNWQTVYVDDSWALLCRRAAPGESCRVDSRA